MLTINITFIHVQVRQCGVSKIANKRNYYIPVILITAILTSFIHLRDDWSLRFKHNFILSRFDDPLTLSLEFTYIDAKAYINSTKVKTNCERDYMYLGCIENVCSMFNSIIYPHNSGPAKLFLMTTSVSSYLTLRCKGIFRTRKKKQSFIRLITNSTLWLLFNFNPPWRSTSECKHF